MCIRPDAVTGNHSSLCISKGQYQKSLASTRGNKSLNVSVRHENKNSSSILLCFIDFFLNNFTVFY